MEIGQSIAFRTALKLEQTIIKPYTDSNPDLNPTPFHLKRDAIFIAAISCVKYGLAPKVFIDMEEPEKSASLSHMSWWKDALVGITRGNFTPAVQALALEAINEPDGGKARLAVLLGKIILHS